MVMWGSENSVLVCGQGFFEDLEQYFAEKILLW